MAKRLSMLLLLPLFQTAFAADLPAVGQVWEQARQNPEGAFSGIIATTGTVTGTEISRYLTPVVQISDRTGGRLLANCVLPRSHSPKLSSYKAGDKVRIEGRYHGFFSNAVVMKNCAVAKTQ